MVRRIHPTPTSDAPDPMAASLSSRPQDPDGDAPETDVANAPDLTAFPVVGLTRRRMAGLLGALLAVWIVVVFARQVGDASAASGRAEAMVLANAQRRSEVADSERELDQIRQSRYVLQQARAYGLGGPHEIAFSLDPAAPPLADDAPGSAGLRLGAPTSVSPLERWLTILFGPGD